MIPCLCWVTNSATFDILCPLYHKWLSSGLMAAVTVTNKDGGFFFLSSAFISWTDPYIVTN